jgi:hypothetical protein
MKIPLPINMKVLHRRPLSGIRSFDGDIVAFGIWKVKGLLKIGVNVSVQVKCAVYQLQLKEFFQ